MKKLEKVSPVATELWLLAGLGAVLLGFAEYAKYQPGMPHYRDATPREERQLDGILRPAAVNAAQAAIKLYSEHPLRGFTQKPPDAIPPPENAVELYIQGHKYTVTVDMQRRHGHLNPNTVYDVGIFRGKQTSALSISSENYTSDYVMSDLLYAETADQNTTVDMMAQVTNSDVTQSMKDARKIAALADQEIATFSRVDK